MKKIFTLFAALMMVISMFAASIPAGTKLYLTPNANWKQSNARFAAYFFGNGEAWVSMTKVEGETDLYELTSPNKSFTNVIFCRMNPSASANNWNNKWNQTADLTFDGTLNHYTVKAGTWDKGGGTWSIWPVPAEKTYKDITITVVANATPKIHWWNGGDKLADSNWDARPEMTPTDAENTYAYTLKEVDDVQGVQFIISVGDVQSADQHTTVDVTKNFKEFLPQVAVMGVNNWDGTDKMTVADDYKSASITLALVENKAYQLKLTVDGNWVGGSSVNITKDKNSASFAEDTGGDGKITTDIAGDYVFTYTYANKTLTVTYPELIIPALQGTVEFNAPVDVLKGNSSAGDNQTLSKSGVNMFASKGILGNASEYRFYASHFATFTCDYGKIVSVEFLCKGANDGSNGPAHFIYSGTEGTYAYADYVGTWTGETDSLVLKANKQVRATKVVVTYVATDPTHVPQPAIFGDVDFVGEVEVTMASAENTKIYYTIDGTEPTTASTEYTAPFTLKETATVKAIAYYPIAKASSQVAELTFTHATKVTCQEAYDIAAAQENWQVPTETAYYVIGYVTDSLDRKATGEQRFTLSDAKDGKRTLMAQYSYVPYALPLGTKVQLVGKIQKYNTGNAIQAWIKDGKSTILPQDTFTVAITAENGTVTGAGEYLELETVTLKATPTEGYAFVNWTEGDSIVSTDSVYTFVITKNVALVANFESTAPEYALEEMVEIANLTTETLTVGEATYLQLTGRNDMLDSDVMLFLNNYTGEDKEYEVNAENSLITFGGLELTVVEGKIAQAQDAEKGAVYAGRVIASVEEEGVVMLVALDLNMYSTPAMEILIENATASVDAELAVLTLTATWLEGDINYPVKVSVAGYEAEGGVKYYTAPQVSELEIGDDINWYDWAVADEVAVITTEEGNISIEGEYTSFATGKKYNLFITGTLPVVEEPEVEKPEPVYEDNTLNPFAFGLESKLSEDLSTLTVTYRLNNSKANYVDVLVYNGEEVVAKVEGTTNIGKNTVEIATAELPAGVQLTWAIQVQATSVDAPTQEEKMYNLYCPHGLAIDKDPESEYFGRILVADAMDIVKDKAGYLGYGIGAGLHVFNPSFTTDSTVYQGGNDFTRILASNGYQPWRVKISEDGRIFVSSLDLNGVVVWEVSKDLQTWTPVIAGTNDATDYNIYEDSIYVAGPNCSMDVVGSGENLKLLLYSTNNKGIAFNQSGYRLDEYALGTATTWTGAPKNILTGGAYGVVHTNVEFIYDGEGGYWFGGSRAGNAGQANLAHINAEGVEDYRSEDASLYGGDGVLVHNGMLFKGKARTSSTVGNFGVWTIGKDAEGKTTLTEKWTVSANGIGRNLNEFAVDYAENLYVVGNSGEKIIAYALPYSGTVETPAAAKYAFQLPAVEMVGTVKRAVQLEDAAIVLTHEADGTAHIYKVNNGVAKAELSQNGVIARDPENLGDLLAISDIAVTEDGKLVAVNSMVCQAAEDYVDAGYKRGETRFYIWNDLTADPTVWFKSNMYGNWFRSKEGGSMAVKGTSTNAQIMVTSIHATKYWSRFSVYSVIDGVYNEPADAATGTEHYTWCEGPAAGDLDENVLGVQYELNASPAANSWIVDAELADAVEFVQPEVIKEVIATLNPLAISNGKKFQGASIIEVEGNQLFVAPYANEEGLLAGVQVLNITNGFAAAEYVDLVTPFDAPIAATAVATAVKAVENGLEVTLVVDNAIHMTHVGLEFPQAWEIYEEDITNLSIDLDNLILYGGPSANFQVEVILGLGESNLTTGEYQLKPESMVSILGQDAIFVEGYVYEIDAFAPSAKAVIRCIWNEMNIELHLNMSAAPLEATVVVVENAKVEIEKFIIFGDVYDYSLKMTGVWTNEGVDYPVLVEVPVYYPEATEPSTIFSTVTVGGWGDNDPWLGFGEGDLTVTTVGNTVTATGIVQNPMAGIAIDITISGTINNGPGTGIEDATVTIKTVKMIKNGKLIINKDGVEYDAQGAIVK